MSKMRRFWYSCIMISLCANFATQESEEGKEKPKVNFEGILLDNSGQSYTVENITIGGIYKSIPVYSQPAQNNQDPLQNTTFLDLAETSEIRTVDTPAADLVYLGRPYVKIEVISKDSKKTTFSYLVETSRKIMCDIRNDAGPLEKQIAFPALKTLTITDHKARVEKATPPTTGAPDAKVAERNRQCEQASKAIYQLEQETEKLSGSQKGTITELVESVKNWVGGLCSS